MLSLLLVSFLLVSTNAAEFRRQNSNASPGIDATNEEVSQLISSMRSQDTAKLSLEPNYQGHTFSNGKQDKATRPLFPKLDPKSINTTTYQALRSLYDNFEPNTGVAEVNTPIENREIDAFLDAVFNTTVMQSVRDFLRRKNYRQAADVPTFKAHLKSLWFDQYSRAKGKLDTSAFEHVFIGELKNSEVQGMHNWYRFYHLEQQGNLDYKGFIIKRGNIFAMVQFEWLNTWKPTGSFLMGTSPEFDFSLYTLCFIAKPGMKRCKYTLEREPLDVTSHPLPQNGKTFIGSVYPTLP